MSTHTSSIEAGDAADAVEEAMSARTWGSTAAERDLFFPCDRYLPHADEAYFRAVAIEAPPATVFRWLCQLQVSSYTYGSRRPPLTAGLEHLVVGGEVMGGFRLAEFETSRHLTLVLAKRDASLFGDVAVSYLILPQPDGYSRLVVKVRVKYPQGGRGRLIRWLLPWGDLVMMRKQLLTLKAAAARSSANVTRGEPRQ